jgi:predicted transcriptional regulator
MQAKREYRDRDATQVAVLDALVDRSEEGMTVLELRSHVDTEIDQLEGALGDLKGAGLIEVESKDDRTVIYPDDRVVPEPGERKEEGSLLDELRRRLPF